MTSSEGMFTCVRYYTAGVYQPCTRLFAQMRNVHQTKHLSLLLFFFFPFSLPPSLPPFFLPLSSYSHDLRVIMDSEIGFALLHKSIENYCNPRSGTGELSPSYVCTSSFYIPFHSTSHSIPPPIPFHVTSCLLPDHLLWNILKVPIQQYCLQNGN